MTDAVDTRHPDWTERAEEWRLMRDSNRGETAIKDAGKVYLPQPSGFAKQADGGVALYAAYQKRAQFAEIVLPAVMAMVGVIHQAEIKVVIPDSMAKLWERATADGLPLEAFHRRITAELLLMGRYAVLVDAPSSGDLPWLAGYQAESLINWAEDRSMFVLNESGLVRNGFEWTDRKQYLALLLENGKYVGRRYDGDGNPIKDKEGEPTTAKGDNLTEIPIVVMGPRDLSLKPETPPCIGIARSAVSMYQLSADYRWQLFMTGQETFVVINGEAPETVGAGVVISLQGNGEGKQPDAKYVGPAGTGIAAHRVAITDEQQNAANAGARLFNSGQKTAESGDALRIRYTSETASLISVAHASCAGLEKALRYAGRMMGLGETEIGNIVVTPPKTLVERTITPQQMTAIMGLWEKGLISGETAYENLQAGNVASAERDWAEEQDMIAKEQLGAAADQMAAMTPPDVTPAAK
ncbi:DUF4055 domain-containing protein [Pseudaminobacter soli (ex Li et al. 2025)]|uniref:DUF4055 domain-containing protein n=1 Tax=Pseudaminobacter soli (ex Li et al. 2025) TaxID=1295366 RepID=A0A2P7SE61_9HYPH|nr:DUF4055 domain-containing protein [Mesorhizobium soli]PSJ60757.1 hypothetical protein C7I85_11995 [Mesorhizobium soli]